MKELFRGRSSVESVAKVAPGLRRAPRNLQRAPYLAKRAAAHDILSSPGTRGYSRHYTPARWCLCGAARARALVPERSCACASEALPQRRWAARAPIRPA